MKGIGACPQPYRTTPLVLPGAKVKKDAAQTESYLRHHPNPMFRAPPSHYDPSVEVLMKQKVADTVLQRVVGEEAAGTKHRPQSRFRAPALGTPMGSRRYSGEGRSGFRDATRPLSGVDAEE
ncbi:Uncharacterized protein GBIM_13633 [Gryllus bimaculatus]|nr:Uncharacterized protein GBIM_13633 [Gryllus bimaculatus]